MKKHATPYESNAINKIGKGFRSEVDDRELYCSLASQAEALDTEEGSEMVEGPPGHRLINNAPVSVVASMITNFPKKMKIPEIAVKADKRRTLRIIRENAE